MGRHALSETQEFHIKPAGKGLPLNLRELWTYRELLWFLTLRDIKVRYRHTVLGVSWAILQPFFLMVVMNLLFNKVGKMPTGGLPGPIFYYAGLLVWNIFQKGLQDTSQSLLANASLITKVYFPRLIIPLSSVLSALVDFTFASLVFAGLMLYYRVELGPQILLFPFFVLLAVLMAISVGVFFSALNVKYRDVRHTLPFLTQVWMYASIVLPASEVHGLYGAIYRLNPMAGIIEGSRFCLTGKGLFSLDLLLPTFLVTSLFSFLSLWYFYRAEEEMADLI